MTALVWPTGRGSDWYGACELCGNPCPEMYVSATARVVETYPDGSADMRPVAPWIYGHRACVTQGRRRHVDVTMLPRIAVPGSPAWRVPAKQASA